MWPRRRTAEKAEETLAEFLAGRCPQADEQFIAECELPATPEAERIARAVRRSFTGGGRVDCRFIRASDRYPEELSALPGWDSLDVVEWVFELERELGCTVPCEVVFRDVGSTRFTVRELVDAVYRWRQCRDHTDRR